MAQMQTQNPSANIWQQFQFSFASLKSCLGSYSDKQMIPIYRLEYPWSWYPLAKPEVLKLGLLPPEAK